MSHSFNPVVGPRTDGQRSPIVVPAQAGTQRGGDWVALPTVQVCRVASARSLKGHDTTPRSSRANWPPRPVSYARIHPPESLHRTGDRRMVKHNTIVGPNRRRLRLPDYDYSSPGAYFLTIVTSRRDCLFGEVVDSVMQTNAAGVMVWDWWARLESKFPWITADESIVMPNHVHGILLVGADPRVRPPGVDGGDVRADPRVRPPGVDGGDVGADPRVICNSLFETLGSVCDTVSVWGCAPCGRCGQDNVRNPFRESCSGSRL